MKVKVTGGEGKQSIIIELRALLPITVKTRRTNAVTGLRAAAVNEVLCTLLIRNSPLQSWKITGYEQNVFAVCLTANHFETTHYCFVQAEHAMQMKRKSPSLIRPWPILKEPKNVTGWVLLVQTKIYSRQNIDRVDCHLLSQAFSLAFVAIGFAFVCFLLVSFS